MIIDNDKFHRLMARIDSHRDEMVQMQRELCAIPAVGPENGGDGELAKATFLQKRLVEMGFTGIRNYNASDERVSSGIRPNLIVTVPGTNSTKFIWIITHLDIVPPGEIKLWSHNPYDAIVRDGHIYGRGVEDNQQDMVSSIFAAQSLREEGIIPFNSIRLAFIADEEAARVKGLLHVLETNQNIFSKDDLIIVPDSGNPAGSFIEIAEKSMLWLRFRTIGKQCHGSKPQLGKNAFVAASHLVTKLIHLKKLFPHTDAIFDPPASTFEPTKKEANVGNI
ncbi:MAG TPA: M20 family metallo-hydrolase, partial [Smithellaceae bacterium]|nr:M20 family metallo-hydrolase [Smithellaceae bacterium]